MAKSPLVLDVLRESSDPAADDALLSALKTAPGPAIQAIVETVLLRRTRAGLRGLVMLLHLLDEPLQKRVMAETDPLFAVLREASQSREEQVQLNVLQVIRRGNVYRASYLLEGAFHDRSGQVREAAAHTVRALADQILKTTPIHLDDDPSAWLNGATMDERMARLESDWEDRRQLTSAIEAGLAAFDLHRQVSVVEAALWFIDEVGARFWALAAAPGSRMAQAALRLFRKERSPRLVPFAMMALNYSQFRPEVAQILGECTDPKFLEAWLREGWRLAEPKAARAMAAVKELRCTRQHAAELLRVPGDAQRFIPRWITASGLPAETKADVLRELHRGGAPPLKRDVIWALIQWRDPHATELLQTLARESDRHLARLARFELTRRQPAAYPLAELLGTHPADIAPAAEPSPPSKPTTFEQYWEAFDALANEQKIQYGRTLLTRSPAARAHIERRLRGPHGADRVRALAMMTLLDLVEPFAEQVYQLSHDPEPQVRSAAVSALGRLPNATSRRILHNALQDQDPRVQANAVEAVDNASDASTAETLLPKLASPDNRIRANAVKALLKLGVREAAETLLRMLEDQDRAQRISALWLVENMGLFTLATRITAMAASDDDAHVRSRAQNLVDRLGPPPTQPTTARFRKEAPMQKVATP